ncbi:MAG TPA: hypothetical protein VGE13_00840 [Candidatus Saccharimonadales bacterium]
MGKFTNGRRHERGAAHFVALLVFVALVGVVGFVGYNAWQKQTSNAGGRNTVGTRAEITAAKKKITSLESQLAKANATLKEKIALAEAASEKFVTYRNAQMKADPAIDKQFRAKWAAGNTYIDLREALKKQVATAKQRSGISAKERRAINATEKKVEAAKTAYEKASKPADTIREKWAAYKTYAAAKAQVEKVEKKIEHLTSDLKKAKNRLAKLQQKKDQEAPATKNTPSRASCPADKPVRGFAKGVCYPKYTAWQNDSCTTVVHFDGDTGKKIPTTTCEKSRKHYYEIPTSSGVGYSTEHK